MSTVLDRSKIGTLRTPHICVMTLRGRLKDVRSNSPLTVAADAKGTCYASRNGTMFNKLLDEGYLELIGVYTKTVEESVMWDDIVETAKECGIRG